MSGERPELKWPVPAWMCQDVNLDSTLRLVHEHISCGGSSLLVGAGGETVLREGRTRGQEPGPRMKQ